jgi:hypothetical protein
VSDTLCEPTSGNPNLHLDPPMEGHFDSLNGILNDPDPSRQAWLQMIMETVKRIEYCRVEAVTP